MPNVKNIVCRIFTTLLIAGAGSVIPATGIYAEPEWIYKDYDGDGFYDMALFDAQYYAAANPDVTAVYGSDEDSLFRHYIEHGKQENRKPYDDSAEITTEAEAASRILALKSSYPEGMSWTGNNMYFPKGNGMAQYLPNNGACNAFAALASDTAFGEYADASLILHCPADQIRVGDIVEIPNSTGGKHYVIVTGLDSTGATIAEGNYNRTIHWGRHLSNEELASNYCVITRWPIPEGLHKATFMEQIMAGI